MGVKETQKVTLLRYMNGNSVGINTEICCNGQHHSNTVVSVHKHRINFQLLCKPTIHSWLVTASKICCQIKFCDFTPVSNVKSYHTFITKRFPGKNHFYSCKSARKLNNTLYNKQTIPVALLYKTCGKLRRPPSHRLHHSPACAAHSDVQNSEGLDCQVSAPNFTGSFCSRKQKKKLLNVFLSIFRYLHRHTVKRFRYSHITKYGHRVRILVQRRVLKTPLNR
jgi:hypothetical protein